MYWLKFNTIITIEYSIMNPCAYAIVTNVDIYNVDLFWKYIAGTQYCCDSSWLQSDLIISKANINWIMYGLPWIMISWSRVSNSPMSFTRDCMIHGIHWQFTSQVTRKSLFMVSHTEFNFHFACFLMLWRHYPGVKKHWSIILPWTAYSNMLLSHPMSKALILWRHHRQLF